MSSDLGPRLSQWILLARTADPTLPPPEAAMQELWHEVLWPLVRRHQLRPDTICEDGRNWDDHACQRTCAFAFLGDAMCGLPDETLRLGVETPLLVLMAQQWGWQQHRHQDPLGCRVYRAMRMAFLSLLEAGSPLLELCGQDKQDWLQLGVLRGAEQDPARMAGAQDLKDMVRRGGWGPGMLHCSDGRLRTWISSWLQTVPSLWHAGPWPGATAKSLLHALVSCAHEDAPRTTSFHHDEEGDDYPIPDPRNLDVSADGESLQRLLERALTPDGLVCSDFARRFYKSVRSRLVHSSNRPRRWRLTRLAQWMLTRLRDRIDDAVEHLPAGLTAAVRQTALHQVVQEQLEWLLEDWPTEEALAIDFYRPRIRRGLFRQFERAQQAEDRLIVRDAIKAQLAEELK